MNLLDFVLLIFLSFYVAFGWKQGFFLNLFGIAGLLAGIYAGTSYSRYPVSFILRFSDLSPGGVSLISFLAIFVAVVLIFRSIGVIVRGIVSILPAGKLTGSILGAALGLARGIITASLLLTIILAYEVPKDLKAQLESSRFRGPIEGVLPKASELLRPLVPDRRDIYAELQKGLREGFAPGVRKNRPSASGTKDAPALRELNRMLKELPERAKERNHELEKLLREVK